MQRVFVAFVLLLIATPVYAVQYSNDSNSVDINYTGAAPSEEGASTETGGSPGGSQTGGETSGGGSDTGVQNSNTVTVTVTVSGGSSQTTRGTGATGESTSAPGAGSSNQEFLTPQDVVNALTGNQALLFGAAGGVSGNGASDSGADAAQSWGSLKISGAKARAALVARGITTIDINIFGGKFMTRGDATMALASSILKNQSIENVVLSLGTFSIGYKAQGRLFGVFPMQYPVNLTVNARATTLTERVVVKFPWYSFLLTKYQSKKAVQADIDSVVTTELQKVPEDGNTVDLNTRVFTAVSDRIKERLDTVSGSF